MRECESAKVEVGDVSSSISTVAVVGLGLIGGSLARDLAGRGVRVLGWTADPDGLRAAVAEGAVHHPLDDGLAEVEEADAVVLAVPVLAAAEVLRRMVPRLGRVRLVTDVGSTKTSIVRAAEEMGIGERFVGSHPFTGDHRSGWSASRAGLFAGARVFLCPTRTSSDAAMDLARTLWATVGAHPETIDADVHDVRLAWTSHLPQVVSSALGVTIDQTGTARGKLGPGGRDVTRLAGSDPAVWADILVDNSDALASALAMMSSRLSSFSRAIANRDRDALQRLLTDARSWHQRDP